MSSVYFSSPSWSRAFTLPERVALLAQHHAEESAAESRPDSAEILLEHWRSQPQFQNETMLDRRLAHDGLDQNMLLRVLETPPEALRPPLNDTNWFRWITEGYSQPASSYVDAPPGAEELCFLDLIQPLVDFACEELLLGSAQIASGKDECPFAPDSIEQIFLNNLPDPLLTRLARTLVLELNVSRLEGKLEGETSNQRFQSFIEQIRQPDVAATILSEYPVLARQLVYVLNQWVDATLEFLARLVEDWKEIKRYFFDGRDPGLLADVTAGAGDTHRGGRSVMIARFVSGENLVYKPKSMAVDRHFQELITWIDRRDFRPTLATLNILDCGDYGWAEYIPHAACQNEAEVERFYQRLGAYLCLLYAINASDFHLENLIACGEHPMLIDLETLFNPEFERFEVGDAASSAVKAMMSSVLIVGMLPQRLWAREAFSGVDISGFGGAAGQMSPDRVPLPDGLGTDEMRYVRRRLEMEGEANRPILNGEEASAVDYLPHILLGFRTMYRFLCSHHQELLAAEGPLSRFAGDETRVLLRPTRTYDQLLFESFHPDVLRDALRRDLLFDRLWMVVPERPFMALAIRSEQEDLRQGDIPVFTTRPASLTLLDASGNPIEGILLQSGMEIVRQRISSLNEADLARQEWIIDGTIATLSSFDHGFTDRPETVHQIPFKKAAVSRDRLLSAAREIADRLAETSIAGQEDVTWLGLEHLGEGSWDLSPASASLYNGLAGIAFFLAFAGSVLKEQHYTELARKSVNGILLHVDEYSSELPEIGAFEGWGGPLYTLIHLATLWNDARLLSRAEDLVSVINQYVEADENYALFDGAAGAISPLLGLFHVNGSAFALDTAVACGDHLLASSQTMSTGIGWATRRHDRQPLLGYAYGASGIAASLTQLFLVTRQQRFYEGAAQAFAYENSLYSTAAQNWPDLRQASSQELRQRLPVAWCHGAAGIGLARLQALTASSDSYLFDDLRAALYATIHKGFGHDHSLCHGDLGLLELLLLTEERYGEAFSPEPLYKIVTRIMHDSEQRGWLCGGPGSVETPGLMIGLAGIGYQLLRLAVPHELPSILTLEWPQARNQTAASNRHLDNN